MLSLQTQKLTSEALNNWQELKIQYKATEEQTVQVSVVNASARVSTLFDDLTLTQEPPLIVQENHYDPWGLNLAGIEVQGNPNHEFQYTGKEKQDEFGLNWTDFGARMYDMQLGRWHTIDPLAEKYYRWSPYTYALDNPIMFRDIDGRDIDPRGLNSGHAAVWQKVQQTSTFQTTFASFLPKGQYSNHYIYMRSADLSETGQVWHLIETIIMSLSYLEQPILLII